MLALGPLDLRIFDGSLSISSDAPLIIRVEEITQEVFIRAFRQLPAYEQTLPFWPWLRGIARNVILETFRGRERAARERNAFAEALLLRQAEQEAVAEENDADPKALEALRGCVQKLSESSRRLLQWFYEEGLSSEEIAPRLKCGSSAVRNALMRMRQGLRECVRRQAEPEAS